MPSFSDHSARRLAVLVTHPIQYFAPVFRELSKQEDIQTRVFFGCDHGVNGEEDPYFKTKVVWDSAPTSGFDHVFLSQGHINRLRGLNGAKIAWRAAKQINQFRPDAVLVFSYSPLFISAATCLLKLRKNKLLLRAETSDVATQRSPFKNWLRDHALKLYYRQFHHFFPIGSLSEKHYRRLGVKNKKMTKVFYAVDVDFFARYADQWLPQREELREKMGIPADAHVLMFCGKLHPPKNPLIITESIRLLPEEIREKLWLFVVGDGELRAAFEKEARLYLGDRARFVGFKNQSELGEFYSIADTFILPSSYGETWGLVVNEAMQFGLNIIVSDRVGCAVDLVLPSSSGRVFPSDKAEALAEAIAELQRMPACRIQRETPHPKDLAQAVVSYLQKNP
ncbi:MAG: glycosyltransferase family 4 protein [bacterium]